MALTPEDVVNKRFQPTKFREGYDQDEVDDFLDEVVVELRRLNQENEELRARLTSSDSKISELQRTAAQPAPAAFAAAPPPAAPAPEAFAAPAPAPAYVPPAAVESSIDTGSTNNLLQLARRLHEEHVREGVEKRDALIAEGQSEAQRIVAEAEQAKQARIAEAEQATQARIAEAEQATKTRIQEVEQAGQARLAEIEREQRAKIAPLEQERTQLEQERNQLEGAVEELRIFEREYRQKLKGYIEGQLRELDSVNLTTSGESAPVSAGASYQAPTPPPASYPGFAQS
jgi:DivIVA domain-containing protein